MVRDQNFVFTSDIVGRNPQTGQVPDDLGGEIRQALSNLDGVLTAAGVARTAVVKTLCFITDPKDFALFDREYGAFLRTTRPARITVTVRLARHLLRLWTPDGDTCVLDVPLRHFGDNPIARYAERSGEPGVFAE